jgi:hypothetical protein
MRPRPFIRRILCAALAAALCAFVGVATATSSKRKSPRRQSCTAHPRRRARHVTRHTKQRVTRHAKRSRKTHRKAKRKSKAVRCATRAPKRRTKPPAKPTATPLAGQGTSTAAAPASTSPTATSAASMAGAKSLAPTTQAGGFGLNVGVVTSIARGTEEASRMSQVEAKSGAKWVREMFDWSMIEPQSGQYDFSNYDTLMTLASQSGVHVLAQMFTTPSWAGASPTTIPDDPSAFASFVAAVVARYGPHGSFWTSHPELTKDPIETFELWNEPYYDNGNNGDYNPGRYARLVKAATTAGRAADPSAKFLLAAENQCAYVNGTWVWWVDALYQAVPDLNSYFDGVAVHPYGTDFSNLTYPTPGQAYDGYDQIRRVESIHVEFANHGAADKPFWITEVGWPTCTNGGSVRCTTPAGQASNIQAVFTDARTIWKSFVRALFIYGFQDNNANTADPEDDYGLVDFGGTPKPALSVFRANQ